MPTASKLVGAIVLAFFTYMAVGAVRAHLAELDDGLAGNSLTQVCVPLALIIGWRTVGGKVGRGIASALNTGVYGAVVVMVSSLFVFATAEMIRLSTRMKYGGPAEAILDIFVIGGEYGMFLLTMQFALILLIGGAITGLVADLANRRWS